MRVDRLSSLKQKLRRGSDSFDFAALIQGVSTIEGEQPPAREEMPVEPPPAEPPPPAATAPVEEPLAPARDPQPAVEQPVPPAHTVHPPEHAATNGVQPALPLPIEPSAGADRLRLAAEALVARFHAEVRQLAGALARDEMGAAGLRLARVNQTLELLHSFDPGGDLARQFGLAGAPPAGRAWPATAWSLAELAESPLSALLPATADDDYARRLLTIAWRAG